MSWAKLDDQLHANKKIALLESDVMLPALGLYTLALSWVASELTNGFVPKNQVSRLCGDRSALDLAEALVHVNLWEHRDGGFQIHDYLDYNPSREQVMAEREAKREGGRRGGKASAQARAQASPQASPQAYASASPQADTQADSNSRTRTRTRTQEQMNEEVDGELDRLAAIALREIRDNESSLEDYRTVVAEHLGRLPFDIIESTIYYLSEWEPKGSPPRKWHKTLATRLSKKDPPDLTTDDGYKLFTSEDIPEHLRHIYCDKPGSKR